jgi:O-antigen ligase
VTASFGLTILFRGSLTAMASEWLSLTMLAFYFPVKEALLRDSRAPKALLFTLGALTLFIGLRNFSEYFVEVLSAAQWWQVTSGRVVENEQMLMMAAIGTFALMLYARTWLSRISLFGLFMLFTAGVIISLSRAIWLSLALGLIVIFVLVDRRRKMQLTLLVIGSVMATAAVGLVLFQDVLTLILVTLFDRLLSLESAFSADISLINRFIEIETVWELFKHNPILGYGFGVDYRYYSLVYEHSRETSFVHNGYFGLLYRHGLLGTVLLLYFYAASAWHGVRLYLDRSTQLPLRVLGLIAVACLVAVALVTNSNNPFAVSDKTLMIAAAAALAAGSWERRQVIADISTTRQVPS